MQTCKQELFTGWSKCPSCAAMLHKLEICEKFLLCPKCEYHFTLSAKQRIDILSDENTFEELFSDVVASDVLQFEDTKPYSKRLEDATKKTGKKNAITTGVCQINGQLSALAVMDFSFMGGSLGRGEGERLTRLIEYATKKSFPIVIICASGGARMQESMYSLMQMAKTSAALKKHQQKGLFYLSCLTNPTMGGVSASFAFLGDIIIAEPGALIGFAGPRVIEQTIGEKLKEGDQKAEFQLRHGMIDQIVHRTDMKNRISYFLERLANKKE